jgi:hypothetical protein
VKIVNKTNYFQTEMFILFPRFGIIEFGYNSLNSDSEHYTKRVIMVNYSKLAVWA